MATKIEAFFAENKIDPRRLLAASRQIERLRPEDRAIKRAQREARREENAEKRASLSKPRSGRTVSAVCLANALAGKKISGPAKTRILRAVNRILGQKKQPAVALGALFEA
ncbi:MAG: hypothetical protein HY744_27660 [Deltaproteobacteria bacterium]|nr:hypothetical protein [Deltaproteobacteria bacterium]